LRQDLSLFSKCKTVDCRPLIQADTDYRGGGPISTFDNREKSEEARYKHDEEFRFRIIARRNKLLGLWAAEQMGLSESDANAYASEIVELQFEKDGDSAVLLKIFTDLASKGLDISDGSVRAQMDDCLAQATAQLTA
jgi:hypothetical protein